MIRIRFICALIVSFSAIFALGNESRDIDLRGLHYSRRVDFENYVGFVDDRTVMIGFEAVNAIFAPEAVSRTGKRFHGNFAYTVATMDFDSGKLRSLYSFSTTGIPTLLPLGNGNFILSDAKEIGLYSSQFQRIAAQPVSQSSKYRQVSLSSDERLVFLRENSGNDSAIEAFRTVDLGPVAHTVIPDLPIGGFGRVVIDSDVLLISRPMGLAPKPTTLYYRTWNSPEVVFSACASGIPLLITLRHSLIVNCPPLTIANADGHPIATNPQVGEGAKESIAGWSTGRFVESRNGNRLATSAARLGGGIEALDIGPHITHERVIVLDSTNLTLIRSIPVRKHRSIAPPVALSADGSRLAYIHGFILTLTAD